MSVPIVDLHCHILPGIDDGAKDICTTFSLIKQELAGGVSGLMFTPHFYYERDTIEAFASRRAAAFAKTTALINERGIRMAVNYGAEVYFSPALPSLDLETLAFHGTDYILIELPTRHRPSGVDEVLYSIECQGFIPIIAHVERYPYVTEDPTLLYEWVTSGALAQINAAPMIRRGRTARMLRKYIDWGLVHFMCSDAHSPDNRPANLGMGIEAVSKDIADMFKKNALTIFNGEDIIVPDTQKPRRRFGRWV